MDNSVTPFVHKLAFHVSIHSVAQGASMVGSERTVVRNAL